MNKLVCTAFSLIAAFAALPAAAQSDVYVGAAIGNRGNMDYQTASGPLVPTNHPRSFNVYAGYDFTEQIAIEAGYTSFGDFKYSGNRKIDLSAFYVAAKGTIRINEAWSTFGKLGLARHKIDVTGAAMPIGDMDKTRALVALGVAYQATKNLTIDLQLANYGRIKSPGSRLTFNMLQLGVNYSF